MPMRKMLSMPVAAMSMPVPGLSRGVSVPLRETVPAEGA
jgi:hypothetical protein